jgi:cyclopropane-fatty-acyl-phospholipid synthase
MATVAETLEPLVRGLLGDSPPVAFECWDESRFGPADAPATIIIRSPDALRRLAWSPNELGLGRAYVAGEIDIRGDVFAVLAMRDLLAEPNRHLQLSLGFKGWLRVVSAARRVGGLGFPPAPPLQEARLRGPLHSRKRDAAAISHHYDVGNDFYRHVLGETMTYSCAYFPTADASLEDAQIAKYELISRKLGLAEGMRLLDVGCGWGGMVIHAANRYGVRAVGITLSHEQAELASKRVAEAGCAERVEIRLQDYRDVADGPFDMISSIGMFEHVGMTQLGRYFESLGALLTPGGRLLNHAISRPPGPPRFDKHSFIARYVFPDGELHEVGRVVSAMQEHGFEVRDVESLREHYALTLRAWVANLEAHWDEAVALAGAARARIWRLYMAGAAVNFEAGRTSVHQVLGVKPEERGSSNMPLTRGAFVA